MLAGHGCFREYLHKFKHIEYPFCLYCRHKIQNARHALMEYIRFTEERTKIEALLNDELIPRVLVNLIHTSEVACNEIGIIIKNIMERFHCDEGRNRNLNH